jgi:capsular exopolysaccharide synthesis family protein
LNFLAVDHHPLAVVVTSAVAKEGKSSIAANLAIASAEAGSRTLLIDADLRSPSIAEYMGVEGAAGLTNILIGQVDFDDVVQTYAADLPLEILAAGPIPPNAGRLLASDAMTALLIDVMDRYDVILLDCAPLLPVTDAAVLAREVSGAVVVSRLSGARRLPRFERRPRTTRRQFSEALGSLTQLDAEVLGVVVNGQAPKPNSYYGYETADRGRGGRRWGFRRRRPVQRPVPPPPPVSRGRRRAPENGSESRTEVKSLQKTR